MKSLILAAISIMLYGCSNYSAIRKSHINDAIDLKLRVIENTSQISSKSFRIASVVIDSSAIDDAPVFTKTKTLVLPLIVFDYWSHITNYQVGKSQFTTSFGDYLKNSFAIGLSQFGYKLNEDNPDFEISIKIRKVKAAANYEKSGFFYFVILAYGYSVGNSAGPFISEITADITTKEGSRNYVSEITGNAFLPHAKFNKDIDKDADRISHAIELSINELVRNYTKASPK